MASPGPRRAAPQDRAAPTAGLGDRCYRTGAGNPLSLRSQQHHRPCARRRRRRADPDLALYRLRGDRLGLPQAKIVRMLGNVAVEAAFGVVPLLGDLADVVWKANLRNVDIIDEHFGMVPNRR